MSKLAYCPNCKNMEKYSNLTLKCKICGSTIRGSYMNSSEWDTMSDFQKKEFLNNIKFIKIEPETKPDYVNIEKEPSTTPDIQTSDKELIKHVRRIADDLHFIKTVVLIYMIFSIIGALILAAQF